MHGPNIDQVVEFFTQVLDFSLTEAAETPDGIAAAFLSCSNKAHDVAFIRRGEPDKFHHVAFSLDSWHEVGQAADIIARYDIPLDILIHSTRPFCSKRLDRNPQDRSKCVQTKLEEAVERIGQCHCGSLRVIATGEPDRVYLCHCKACQRRTGTAFHFGASYPKDRVQLDGERKVFERDADSGNRIRFHFCPNCGTTLYWEGDRNSMVCGVAGVRSTPPPSRRPAIRSGKSRYIRGSAYRRAWSTTNIADRLSAIKRQGELTLSTIGA